MDPIICFGQQPNGIVPKRFFMAKIRTARRLQETHGGRIVWFVHDSDHDHQETRTRLPDPNSPDGYTDFNFDVTSKTQRKWTPIARKEIDTNRMETIRTGLHHLTNDDVVNAFDSIEADYTGAFCVAMYEALNLLDGVERVHSFDPVIRGRATLYDDADMYYYDTKYDGEIVRAAIHKDTLRLHHGGNTYTTVERDIDGTELLRDKERISPGWKARFDWMQSVITCTHYVMGRSEANYLDGIDLRDKPELVPRDQVDDADFAFIPGR
jgi:Zn/Cd-binding protein ZinT